MTRQVTAVLIGAGGRGYDYTAYALSHPHELRIVAVADPDPERRARFSSLHGIPEAMCFEDDLALLSQPRLADAALICTQDRLHFRPAIQAMKQGYHILLEKPMSPDPRECVQIGATAEQYGRICMVCHVLRYTEFFRQIKALLDAGRIGQLVSIQHNENVGFWHQALSFVRGPWRNSQQSSPMILAKSCHDMDIMLWLAGADCRRVASFGSLLHFRPENAPPGAPEYCQDGCPVEDSCLYYAPAFYLNSDFADWALGLPEGSDLPTRLAALRRSTHGRCVYQCDNDVVDHQVVSLEFANGVTAAFTMCAFTHKVSRTLKLMGTRGELRGSMSDQEIELIDFHTGHHQVIHLAPPPPDARGHGGGDYRIMREFVRLVREEAVERVLTSAAVSVQSHLMAFAAEESRLSGKIVELEPYLKELQNA